MSQNYAFSSKPPRKSQEICKLSANYPTKTAFNKSIIASPLQAVPSRTNMAQGFEASPTLQQSGSEQRRAVTSFFLRRKAWLEVELS